MQLEVQRARRLQQEGRHVEALKVLGEVASPGPSILAEMLPSWLRVDYRAAEPVARRVLEALPDHHLARHQLGESLARQGRFAEAEAELRRGVAADGRLAELTTGAGTPWTTLDPEGVCPHCRLRGGAPVYVGNTSKHQRCFGLIDPIKVWVRCEGCGLVRVSRPPSPERLARYYDALRGDGGDVRPPAGLPLFNGMLAEDALVDRILRHGPGRRLLEIGSAWGVFASVAAYRGFAVTGLETSVPAARWAAAHFGFPTGIGTAPDALPEGPFDVVAMWEVIEHFVDPGAVLRAIAERLAPGGLIALSTPCLDHPFHRVQGYDAVMWTVPGHLVFFDRATLRAVLDEAGLEEVDRWLSTRHIGSVGVIARRRS